MKKQIRGVAKAPKVQAERSHFHFMLAKNPNYFGNIPGSNLKPVFKIVSDTSFEELTCVGYNPDTRDMEATFSIKRPNGYSGDLCHAGSTEYVRFYMDFHDGAGFVDQGSIAVNVHDIPDRNDCTQQSIFPLKYVATLKQQVNRFSLCSQPLLPTLRAILSWNVEPPANSPGWKPVWGSVLDGDIQLKPFWLAHPGDLHLDIHKYLELAVDAPYLTGVQLAEISGVDLKKHAVKPAALSMEALQKKYAAAKVPASRFAYKTVSKMIQFPQSVITAQDKITLSGLKINLDAIIDDLLLPIPIDKSKANVDYEELICLGLDYNAESLVATIKIKKKAGYSGDLCDPGSKEYISFWVDWNDQCTWQYINTVELNVHDIDMPGDALYYTVSLPLDTLYHKKPCTEPNIIRVRSVLSWNVPPSTTDPDKLEFYGNRLDTHVQLRPGVEIHPGEVIPLYNIIGGIDVAHVSDLTGLTTPGSFFAFNGVPVSAGAPFGGIIVVNGPSFPGNRYRFKVTNQTNGSSYYVKDSFTAVGFLPFAPWVQYTTQTPDADGWYDFLPHEKNTLNVLTRFTPGTNDMLRIDMEVEMVPGMFTKFIQMDNVAPEIKLTVNDDGDCTRFKKGDTITGSYYVFDEYISSWGFHTTWGGDASGTTNTPPGGTAFSVTTPLNAYPCGGVSLWAQDKCIVDSQGIRGPVYASYTICLQNP